MRSLRGLALASVTALLVGACASPPPTLSPTPSATPLALVTPTPTPAATPSPTPTPQPTPEPPNECTGRDPKAGVYDPGRLTLLSRCAIVSGTVTLARHETDGDWHVQLRPDYGQEGVLGAKNLTDLDGTLVVRIGCADPITLPAALAACGTTRNTLVVPAVGSHVSVTGPLVRDSANGWNAIHPVWATSAVAGQPPATPDVVLQVRAAWAQLRLKWPQVPPAIVLTEDLPQGVIASASLYPDGLSHVFVRPEMAPDAHQVWHEAGHILHAVAMRARGRQAQLFTPADDVGVSFWAARGFPDAWSEHLATGSWGTLGYEALAECFAAVNLGDAERTEAYGVPLDPSAMRAFFATLAATIPTASATPSPSPSAAPSVVPKPSAP